MVARHPIHPRPAPVDFDAAEIPRHWLDDNVVATHLANAINLLFPHGERFFVRSVHRWLDEIEDDPELREQARGFAGQEGRHAKAHEDFFEVMKRQGYRVDGYLRVYKLLATKVIEPAAPEKLHLATTAALEHYTAVLADLALRSRFLDRAHPSMRDLLYWHAAEEIEHKAVAFDVLQRVAPEYRWRVAGLVLGTGTLFPFWIAAAAMLMWQDRALGMKRFRRDAARAARRTALGPVLRDGVRRYLRRGFHPSQDDNHDLAEDWLRSRGAAEGSSPPRGAPAPR